MDKGPTVCTHGFDERTFFHRLHDYSLLAYLHQTGYGDTWARDIQYHAIMGWVTLLRFLSRVTFPSGVWLIACIANETNVGEKTVTAISIDKFTGGLNVRTLAGVGRQGQSIFSFECHLKWSVLVSCFSALNFCEIRSHSFRRSWQGNNSSLS